MSLEKKSSENYWIPVLIDEIKFYVAHTLSETPSLRAKPELFEKHLKDNAIRACLCLFSHTDTCGLPHLKGKVLKQS